MMFKRQLRPVRAFTMIEIMLAMAIFAMVMIAIYSSWSSILRGSRVALDAAAQAQRTRIAMRALEESLASAEIFNQNPSYYSFFADTRKPQAAGLSFVSRLPASFPGSGLFFDQTLRRVTFSIEAAGGSDRALVLRQSPLLEVPEYKPYQIVLCRDVDIFALAFWNPRKAEWIEKWIYTNQLPYLVKITMGFGKASKFSAKPAEAVTRVVMLSYGAVDRNNPPPPGGFGARTNVFNSRRSASGEDIELPDFGEMDRPFRRR
jgi:prepilin-type N-terminal cleavage/methylation domain-containing protein